MRTILKNGKIYIEKNNIQEAILIDNGIIQQVGTNEEIHGNSADDVIDLQGKTVLPGLNDSHLHLTLVGEAMNSCNLVPAKSIDDVALKLFKDGSLGARTALMLKDYEDAPGTKGVEALSDQQMQDLCNLAAEHRITIVTHAIGDGAVESVINAYEKTMKDGKNPLRHGIVHCQITSRPQLERIAELNIPVMYQPIFLDYDIKVVEDRVGKELASTSYAFNTLYQLGAPISLGTDAPVEDCNPFPNIYCAVTRQRIDGNPAGGFNPSEKMSVEDAIDTYTVGSAFNEFKQAFKGRLKPGYVADLIVLNQDIFTIDPMKIKDIKVDQTMIDGEIVFKRE